MSSSSEHGPGLRARLSGVVDRVLPRGTRLVAALAAITIALGVAIQLAQDYTPLVSLLLPLVVASLILGPRQLPWFVVFVLLVLALLVPGQALNARIAVTVVIMYGIGFLVLLSSFRRSRLGVGGLEGERMFVDLRDRIANQGVIPPLPREWHVDSAGRSAGGTSFGGDFVVASRATDGSTLELIVVDVSGKGIEAGTRALLLSGAFGGLASAVGPDRFLIDANEYLLRHDWAEGFATAIHLHLDLRTGDFELRKAGHPPAVWLHAGSGRWSTLDSDGPVLGLMPDASFEVVRGRMLPDDALLMYTDGVVETVSRDIGSGIDKLAGRAQLLFPSGYDRAAQRLIGDLATHNDDAAVVLVHRRTSFHARG